MQALSTFHELLAQLLALRTLLADGVQRLLHQRLAHLVRLTGGKAGELDCQGHELLLEGDETAGGSEDTLDHGVVVDDVVPVVLGFHVLDVHIGLERARAVDGGDGR